jgi:Ca2+-binding EF-hand superfamily protein
MWYKFLDVNDDGKISLEDIKESSNQFIKLHHLLDNQADSVKMVMHKWWTTYMYTLPSANQEVVSQERFLDRLSASYTKDKAAFQAEMQKCFDNLFNFTDTNTDRSIELNEFIITFNAFGHKKEELVRRAFDLFDPFDGMVPLRDLVFAWVLFVTSEDSSKRDRVCEAFESGI